MQFRARQTIAARRRPRNSLAVGPANDSGMGFAGRGANQATRELLSLQTVRGTATGGTLGRGFSAHGPTGAKDLASS